MVDTILNCAKMTPMDEINPILKYISEKRAIDFSTYYQKISKGGLDVFDSLRG